MLLNQRHVHASFDSSMIPDTGKGYILDPEEVPNLPSRRKGLRDSVLTRSTSSFLDDSSTFSSKLYHTIMSDDDNNNNNNNNNDYDNNNYNDDDDVASFPLLSKSLLHKEFQRRDSPSKDGKPYLPLPLTDLQYHGTTTLAFHCRDGIIVAVDSRASVGNYVGSRTVKKVFSLSDHIVATMAGGAADCAYWIKLVAKQIALLELDLGVPLPVLAVARRLALILRSRRALELSVGTMVAGWDKGIGPSLFYIDSAGSCVKGKIFCVGSGSQLAYSIIDDCQQQNLESMPLDDAVDVAMWAVRHAAHRDGFSGGYINVVHINATGCHHIRRVDSKLLDVK